MRVTPAVVLATLAFLLLPAALPAQDAASAAPGPAPVVIQERSPALAAVQPVAMAPRPSFLAR